MRSASGCSASCGWGRGPNTVRSRGKGLTGTGYDGHTLDAAGFFIPKPFLEYDGAFYDPSSTHIHSSHFWRKDEHSDRR